MTLLMPPKEISAKWNGALQTRLRRAPLEEFLRRHDRRIGSTQPTDNLAGAALLFFERADQLAGESLAVRAPETAALMFAALIRKLAIPIHEPESWRIAALVGAGRLLTPALGVADGACRAARMVRRFETRHFACGPTVAKIADHGLRAVRTKDPVELAEAARLINNCLLRDTRSRGMGASPRDAHQPSAARVTLRLV